MKKTLGLMMIAGATAAVCGVGKTKVSEAPAPSSGYVSPEFIVAAPDGGSVYVTSATGAHVQNVARDGKPLRKWKIESTLVPNTPLNPSGIALSGGHVYVTCGVQAGELQKFALDGKLVKSVAVGHSPCAPVISADGKTVFVLNRFANKVSVIDAAEMKVTATMAVLREPFAAALGAGGIKKLTSCFSGVFACLSAILAALGLILKTLFSVEFLFAGSENKLVTTVFAY